VLAASYQTGYRLAMIWAGAGVFWIAARAEVSGLPAGTYQDAAWRIAYIAMALSMAVGMLTVLFSKEPAHVLLTPARGLREWLQVAVVAPFSEFVRRYRWHAVLLLALMAPTASATSSWASWPTRFMWTWVTPKKRWLPSPNCTA